MLIPTTRANGIDVLRDWYFGQNSEKQRKNSNLSLLFRPAD
jgi:hypothetical protein